MHVYRHIYLYFFVHNADPNGIRIIATQQALAEARSGEGDCAGAVMEVASIAETVALQIILNLV